MPILLILFKELTKENVHSYKKKKIYILTYVKSFLMINKTFIILILSFKIFLLWFQL